MQQWLLPLHLQDTPVPHQSVDQDKRQYLFQTHIWQD